MNDDRRSAIDRAMKEIVSTRASDLALQLQDGLAGKAIRDAMGTGTVASLLSSQPELAISRVIADMQARNALPISAFATMRDRASLATESARLSASLASLQPLTNSLARVSEIVGLSKSSLRPELLSALSGAADAARFNQWAGLNGNAAIASLLAMNGAGSSAAAELARITDTVAGAFATMARTERLEISANLGIRTAGEALQAATQARFAALAGAGDVLGFNAQTSISAYAEIFGRWHTRPDLPQRFWRDPSLRRRRYEEAEVDEGLIAATPSAAVEIIIGSGFFAGAADDRTSIALIDVAGVPMQIRSTDPAVDAYKALVRFEQALRQFISRKLAAAVGPRWMKQRINGPIFAKAKQNRTKALAGGEREQDLLAFVDLGDLGGIMFRQDNWDQVFGDVFPNRERLTFDIETIVATRRPTMHARGVDGVRLLELLCVIRRMEQLMEHDGDWLALADAEE